METNKNILLKIIEHPALFLNEKDIINLKSQIEISPEEDCKTLLELFNEIIQKRMGILMNKNS